MENTTNSETVSLSLLAHAAAALTFSPFFASVEAAALPAGFVPQNIRHDGQKERTKKIRTMLRAAGVKDVSVTSATGSMCFWTHVRFERACHAEGTGEHNRFECPVCTMNRAAEDKLSTLILAAFPDLVDRSDSQTDYSEFYFMVSGR